jgi:hypothetical protein
MGQQPQTAPPPPKLPPRVLQAQRFLAQRRWTPTSAPLTGSPFSAYRNWRANLVRPQAQTPATATWTALGPTAVSTPQYGLVTGRISALALDPSDSTGNRLYLGTTGGGVWVAQNAATGTAANVVFTPLTDTVGALSGIQDASISIGALSVQPNGTGVILAGTGDPNDALDSYYGAGILLSSDGGNSWSLVSSTADHKWSFAGEGFAGFAWSTVNPQVVVAAVSQAYQGTLVNAARPGLSNVGLYVSSDAGTTWNLATVTNPDGVDVQGANDSYAGGDSNAATSVVWNPVRKLFVAALRFHGYYQSADGINWTRIVSQPGAGLTPLLCPTNPGIPGSTDCPIFRGTLAVNPVTGDTFAWTVDRFNQDQGLWQDQCALSGNACTNPAIAFGQRWSTAALETGSASIANGDYTLALAAVPSQQDTLLLAGDGDLWKCSLAAGCVWRNTTNSASCMSAQVGEYQHALAWNPSNPLEIFLGNDSGIWRSEDAIAQTGSTCASTDASHFQNLNGSLGSLAEVVSMAASATTPYTVLAGLGANGAAGVKGTTPPATDWPQILGGEGGPVAIDPVNPANWYVNNGAGVSIHLCSQSAPCTPAAFGSSPVVTNADVGGDGLIMSAPAPFLVDPLDPTQLLIGTCRVWRGPADGIGWGGSNAISSIGILGSGTTGTSCTGEALIRSMAAMALPGGGETIYVATYGSAYENARLAGHIFSATVNPASSAPLVWQDLTLNPVTNDTVAMNAYNLDISSIFVDSHDPTGKTVYVTVDGIPSAIESVRTIYSSTDGGLHWAAMASNLPWAPANSVLVDPQDANTVYLATDAGVYFTTRIATCTSGPANCWSAFGTGLPEAPVIQLSAVSAPGSAQALAAGTYGRGVWQTPLWTAKAGLTFATVNATSLTFASQLSGTASSAQTVTLTNTGSAVLTPTTIAVTGDFSETDNCQQATVNAGASCAIQVTFTPTQAGSRSGQMTIFANVYGGQFIVALSGTATAPGNVTLTPPTVDFNQVEVGTTSTPLQVEAGNSGGAAVSITGVTISGPFKISSNACGTTALQPQTDCQVMVEFAPTVAGPANGVLSFTDGAGTQTVALSGTGAAPPTDSLSPASLTFPGTVIGQLSSAQTVTLANSGDLALTSIAVSTSGAFQVSTNCGTQLAGQSSCSINVVFAPTAAGLQSGTLTVSDLIQTQKVPLSGTGLLPPAFTVSPTSLNFPVQSVGVASAPATLTVTNSGGAPMANIGFQIAGSAAASYATGTTTCGALLGNGSSCTVQVIFTPASATLSAATLVVSSSSLGVTPVSVPLNGNGATTTVLGATPAQLTFPAVLVGQASAAQTVTIANTGSFAATSLVLGVAAPFSLTQNTCASSLAAGASCTTGVVFTPTAAGAATGTLSIASASAANPAAVALSGAGTVPFDFTLTASGATSQTVASGQTASYNLVITPSNGSSGTFTFQCGTLPTNALCLFNPTSETLSAGVIGNVTVQISTGQGTSASLIDPAGWRALPLLCGLLLLPLSWKRCRTALLLAAMLAIVAVGVTSCSGSGGGSGGSSSPIKGGNVTPPGTYSIPVTVSSNNVQRSITLTLTVD